MLLAHPTHRTAAASHAALALCALSAVPASGHAVAVMLGADVQIAVELQSHTGERRASRRVQLVPHGSFAARDGRPAGMRVKVTGPDGVATLKTVTATHWQLGNDAGMRLANTLNERHNPNWQGPYGNVPPKPITKASFGFDYEHQTLKAETNGQPAPRSGSGATFEWKWDEGLFITDVAWTPKADRAIVDREFVYISPVIFFDPDTGEVFDIFNAALVNTPALLELPGLSLDDGCELAARVSHAQHHFFNQENSMNLLQQLLARLGLQPTATESDALAALSAQLGAAATAKATVTAVAAALGADPATATADTLTAGIALARQGQAVAAALGASLSLEATVLADPAKAGVAAAALAARAAGNTGADAGTLQAMAALQAQVAELQGHVTTQTRNDLVAQGLAAGKLVPAQEAWARGLAPAALSAYLAHAPVIAPPASASQGQHALNAPASAAALGADVDAIAKGFGMTAAELLAA